MCGNIWCNHRNEQKNGVVEDTAQAPALLRITFTEECHPPERCVISLIAKDDSVLWLVTKRGVSSFLSLCVSLLNYTFTLKRSSNRTCSSVQSTLLAMLPSHESLEQALR